MVQGRPPGYKHSQETRDKIRDSLLGKKRNLITKEKISKSMTGKTKSKAHRDAISDSLKDVNKKCLLRFLELKSEYPECASFFEENERELILAMQTIKSEQELLHIRKFVETTSLDDISQFNSRYQYDSSSMYAQEQVMISLIDSASFVRKALKK